MKYLNYDAIDFDEATMVKTIDELENKIYNEGCTLQDYNYLNTLSRYLSRYGIKYKRITYSKCIKKLNYLFFELDKLDGIHLENYEISAFSKFSLDNIIYMQKNAYILPLIIANDEENRLKQYKYFEENNFSTKQKPNRFAGVNRYMFICQFHREHTPSMGVRDLVKNDCICYGCAKGVLFGRIAEIEGIDSIQYIADIEHLTDEEAMDLLCQIYLYKIENPNEKFSELAKFYQKAILSDKYKEYLESGKKRLKERNIKKLGQVEFDIDEEYNKRYETIKRIENKEYDKKFIAPKPSQKIIKLRRG